MIANNQGTCFDLLLFLAGILAVVTIRASCGAPIGWADAAALPLVAVGWAFQEWAIHKYLLHGLEVTTRPFGFRLGDFVLRCFLFFFFEGGSSHVTVISDVTPSTWANVDRPP